MVEPLNRDTLSRICDGDHRAIRFFETLTDAVNGLSGVSQSAPASGAAATFTNLPPGLSEIRVMFDGLAISGAGNILIQLGTAAGFEAAGYASTSAFSNGASVGQVADDTGFVVWLGGGSLQGEMTLSRFRPGEESWVASHVVRRSATQAAFGAGGAKTLAAPATQLRVTPTGGLTLTGGRVSLLYR